MTGEQHLRAIAKILIKNNRRFEAGEIKTRTHRIVFQISVKDLKK